MEHKFCRSQTGFSLVELLLVFAAAAILALATIFVVKHHHNVDNSKNLPGTGQTTKGSESTNLQDATHASPAPNGSSSSSSSSKSDGSSTGNSSTSSSSGNTSSSTSAGSGSATGSSPVQPQPDLPGSNCVPKAGYMCPGVKDDSPPVY